MGEGLGFGSAPVLKFCLIKEYSTRLTRLYRSFLYFADCAIQSHFHFSEFSLLNFYLINH